MKYALIQRGIVAAVYDARPELHPDFVVVEAPENVAEGWLYEEGELRPPATPSLEAIRASRLAMLSSNCAAAILSGYTSAALGNPHTYPSGITDQINMMGSVTGSLLPDLAPGWSTPFWCRDQSGIWAFRDHTAFQIQQAGADGKLHVVTCQAQLEALNAQVIAAQTADEVEAVVWPLP